MTSRFSALAAAVLAFFVSAGAALAQFPTLPQTLPANTIVGRTGIGPGPAQVIPFSLLVQTLVTGANTWTQLQTFSAGATTTATHNFFSQNSAIFWRLNDRVLIGGATANDGAIPNASQDWLTQFQVGAGLSFGSIVSSQFAALTDATNASAGYGGVFGAQSLNFTSNLSNALGVAAYAVCNNLAVTPAGTGPNCYAGYFESHLVNNTHNNAIEAIEGDVRALASTITPDPFTQGSAIALQLAAGAGYSSSGQFDASAAIQIVANPMKFKAGIVIFNGSLTSGGGPGGTTPAIEIPAGSHIAAFSAASTLAGYLTWDSSGNGIINNAGNLSFLAGAANALKVYASSGVYIGGTQSDPGANNLAVQGLVILANLSTDSAATTTRTVCQNVTGTGTANALYFGSGTAGICKGTSARFLKQDIAPLDYGLAEIMRTEVDVFRWRPGTGHDADLDKLQVGFMADNIAATMPRFATIDAQGHATSVDYMGAMVTLFRGVQQIVEVCDVPAAANDNFCVELKRRIAR